MHVLRYPEVIKRVGLSKVTIWRMIAAGTFPKPMKLGSRAVGFLASDVDDWITTSKAGEAQPRKN